MSPSRFVPLLGLLTIAASSPVAAQLPDSVTLQPVVVTATREPTPISVTSQPVTVLSGAALRARGITTVADALREVPGASVAQTGSFGSVTSLFMRGGESRYTKVLIDGVAVNTVGGTVFLQNFTLDNVDRIEVVQGPASALYGADAMAGVVQIFTRQGSRPGADVAIDGGSYGTRNASASLRGGSRALDLSLGGGWHRTDGLASFNNGYTNGTLSAAATARPASGTAVHVTSRYTGATYHFPTDFAGNVGDTNSYTREHRVLVGLDASQRVGSRLTVRLLGGDTEVHGLSEDRQTSGSPPPGSLVTSLDRSYGARRTAELRAELALPAATSLTIGIPYEHESESTFSEQRTYAPAQTTASSASGSTGRRTTHGAYVSVQSEPWPWLAYDASARYDEHSDYRSIATYHAGVSVAPWTGGRVRASYGTGFNAPAFYESLGSAYNLPNASLQPEQVRTADVGIEQMLLDERVRINAGAFDQRFTQLIQYTTLPTSPSGTHSAIYENLTAARSRGYTAGVRLALTSTVALDANYTQTIARILSVPSGYQGSERAGDALLRRPSHSGSAAATYSDRGWSAGATVTYVGTRPDLDFQQYPSPTVSLPAYTRIDLSAAIPLVQRDGSSVALTARMQNALGRRYQEIVNFPAPGRTVLLGARLSAD